MLWLLYFMAQNFMLKKPSCINLFSGLCNRLFLITVSLVGTTVPTNTQIRWTLKSGKQADIMTDFQHFTLVFALKQSQIVKYTLHPRNITLSMIERLKQVGKFVQINNNLIIHTNLKQF